VRPNDWRTLVPLVVVATACGWLFARMLESRRGEVGVPPWSAAIVLAASGVALVFTARRTRARLSRRPGTTPVPPLVAARLAALGVAGSRAGAIVAGAYLGYALFVVGDLSTPFRHSVFWRSLACAGGATLVVLGSLLLEHALRLPHDESAKPGDRQESPD